MFELTNKQTSYDVKLDIDDCVLSGNCQFKDETKEISVFNGQVNRDTEFIGNFQYNEFSGKVNKNIYNVTSDDLKKFEDYVDEAVSKIKSQLLEVTD